ncbi:MAG: CDP-diacylglycerol--glycerol-3-phosphate 3-phosphatidyltransferase [Clostridiaceae bacterium]|nr:CDP-diacylglycerol--glycerol-3-phosphate 3-phosphatidyltransferase [Clostridiaceae bacterium]
MNIPNILTMFRFMLIPAFIFVFFSKLEYNYLISALIFIFAGITDVLDGHIARRYNMVTDCGKLMDPLADKLMQLTVIFCLAYKGLVPRWAIYIILVKEILMVLGSILLYKDEIVVSASWYGKASTVMFYLAIIIIILFDPSKIVNTFLIGIAVGSAIFAFIRYSINFRRIKYLKKASGSVSDVYKKK